MIFAPFLSLWAGLMGAASLGLGHIRSSGPKGLSMPPTHIFSANIPVLYDHLWTILILQ